MLENGLMVSASGGNIQVKSSRDDVNKKDAEVLVKALRQHKDEVLAIISDAEATRKTLCEAQEALSEANDHVSVLLDHLDRLEQIYRAVFPDIKECIHGEKGCPEDSIVFCTACAKGRGWKGSKYA